VRLYVAGPMTGVPHFNIPAFDAAAADLRERGFTVFSPAELDDAKVRELALASEDGCAVEHVKATGQRWIDLLVRDLLVVADVDAVIVLPSWKRSRGARLETFVAYLLGKEILRYPALRPVALHILARAWTGGIRV
jgi:hypothetical protein